MARHLLLAILAPCLLAAPAARATPLAFQGTLTIDTALLGTFVFSGSGTGSSDGVGAAASIPSGSFALDSVVLIGPLGGILDLSGICASGVAAGSAFGTPSCAPHAGGSLGAVSFDGATGTGAPAASLYLGTGSSGTTVAEQSLSVLGVGGVVAGTTPLPVALSLTGNPWQLGPLTANGTISGNPLSVSSSGFDARDANGLGTLQLVTDAYFAVATDTIPIVATLQLEFVPEPVTALLLGGGLTGLALRGRRARS